MKNLYRKIPQVAKILKHEAVLLETASFSSLEKKVIIHQALEEIKNKIHLKQIESLTEDDVINRVIAFFKERRPYSLHPVINATGTLLHTNLGRAIFDEKAVEHLTPILLNYTNLEVDSLTGNRTSRLHHLKESICSVVGAEDYLLVNNNAAAVLLITNTLARNKDVLLSRGEMVEIGAQFRIFDVIEASGASVKEVGATNRTTITDYKNSMNEQTSCIIKVHPSNYQITGYTESTSVRELKQLGLPVIVDLGSGILTNGGEYGDDSVRSLLKEGADLVTISGDKLLGGPQVGIIFGSKSLIQTLKNNPLFRGLRVDKISIALLEEALGRFLREEDTELKRLLQIPVEDLRNRAQSICEKLEHVEIIESEAKIGGGTTPHISIPSIALKIQTSRANELLQQLRQHDVPIFGRIEDDNVLLDLRAVKNDDVIKEALALWKE